MNKKKNFAATRVKIFLATCIYRNKSIFVFGLIRVHILLITYLYHKEIEPDEIKKQLKHPNTKKANDLFGISPKLLQIATEVITEPLTYIFDELLMTGIATEELKAATVYRIYKKECKIEVSNYWPISMLPIISNIYEKLIHKRLIDFFDKHNTIYKHQFGIRKGKLTEHEISNITAHTINSIEKKDKASCIFLDFAQETVKHKIWLTKLECYSIRGTPLQISQYLSDRNQCVRIGQGMSNFKQVSCRVQQGSIFAGLLFVIYITKRRHWINDIVNSDSKAAFYLFADDTALFHTNKFIKQFEMDVNDSLENIANLLKAKVFIYEIRDCGFESHWSHFNARYCACFEQGVPWHSGIYRLRIHSELSMWHDTNIQSVR